MNQLGNRTTTRITRDLPRENHNSVQVGGHTENFSKQDATQAQVMLIHCCLDVCASSPYILNHAESGITT